MKLKSRSTLILIQFAIIIGLCILVFIIKKQRPQDDNSSAFSMPDQAIETTPVEVQVIHKQELIQSIQASGYAQTISAFEYKPDVSGNITALNVQEGGKVSKGQLLLSIENTKLRIEYENSRTQLDNALLNYAMALKSSKLTDKELASLNKGSIDDQFDTTQINDREAQRLLQTSDRKKMIAQKSGVDQARISYEAAKNSYDNSMFRSPFNGYVSKLDIADHAYVQAGSTVMELVQLSPLRIKVGILESESFSIKKGTSAIITFVSLPNDTFTGTVATISPVIDRETGTCNVTVQFDNSRLKAKPGMFANIHIATNNYENLLCIPRDALLVREGRKFAFVYSGGKSKWHYVQTGRENQDWIEITEGLDEGDSIIVSGNLRLNNDSSVKNVSQAR